MPDPTPSQAEREKALEIADTLRTVWSYRAIHEIDREHAATAIAVALATARAEALEAAAKAARQALKFCCRCGGELHDTLTAPYCEGVCCLDGEDRGDPPLASDRVAERILALAEAEKAEGPSQETT